MDALAVLFNLSSGVGASLHNIETLETETKYHGWGNGSVHLQGSNIKLLPGIRLLRTSGPLFTGSLFTSGVTMIRIEQHLDQFALGSIYALFPLLVQPHLSLI